MKQEQKNQLAEILDISKRDQEILDAGSDHAYKCRCRKCLQWWVLMGPDGGKAGKYGPFTRDEVIAMAKEMGESLEGLD